ncbi:MAG TPA: hypothetical protein VNR67_00855, partial [Solirubrobacterales bacterium]|nr:hypothetical protein [Solirubrobacterales bacterium]
MLPAFASAHPGHRHVPGFDGRLPGQPDLKIVGNTTYRFIPSQERYEISRPGMPPGYMHADVARQSVSPPAPGPLLAYSETEGRPPLPTNELSPICRNSGNRIVIQYSDGAGIVANPVPAVRSIVRRMNWKIADQASKSSPGARLVRMAVQCDSEGNIAVFDRSKTGEAPFGKPTGTEAVKYLNLSVGTVDPSYPYEFGSAD